MKSQSIVTADDHPLLLKGLNDLLVEKGYNLIGTASDGQEAMELIREKEPDIAILDIQMPLLSGLEIARKCKEEGHLTKVILITLHKEQALYETVQKLNLFGYILKEFALEEIETCIGSVSNGRPYFSPHVRALMDEAKESNSQLESLTPSERKILKLIARDKTNKEIASMLFISHRTVEKHRSNMISKLKLEHKTNSLLIWAKENHDTL